MSHPPASGATGFAIMSGDDSLIIDDSGVCSVFFIIAISGIGASAILDSGRADSTGAVSSVLSATRAVCICGVGVSSGGVIVSTHTVPVSDDSTVSIVCHVSVTVGTGATIRI